MSEKRRSGKAVEHIVPPKDKRAERKVRDILRRPHDIDEDWDELDLTPGVHRYKKHQPLD